MKATKQYLFAANKFTKPTNRHLFANNKFMKVRNRYLFATNKFMKSTKRYWFIFGDRRSDGFGGRRPRRTAGINPLLRTEKSAKADSARRAYSS
jgi:hypothetical protein